MPVASTDLIFYGSASMPQDDVSTTGGAIATNTRVVFTSSTLVNTLNDTVDMASSAAGDTTQTVVVTGRLATGVITTESFSLNGVTQVVGVTEFERILKIVVSGSHVGTITVSSHDTPTTIVTIEPGVLTLRVPFYDVSSDVSGGSTRVFYEKIFARNNHATLALLNAIVSEQADTEAQFTFTLEGVVDGTGSEATRLTAPSGGEISEAFSSAAKNVPGTNLGPTVAIGIWLALTLPAGDAPTKAVYTLRLAGSTT